MAQTATTETPSTFNALATQVQCNSLSATFTAAKYNKTDSLVVY